MRDKISYYPMGMDNIGEDEKQITINGFRYEQA